MAGSEVRLSSASKGDLPEVAVLMRAELGEDIDPEDLKWWFLSNPAGGASIELARDETGVVGMATINDCVIRYDGIPRRFGMPQKVLVSGSRRGKGLFGRLYRASESSALRRGITGFLTFTNAASTPIFLSKFGYRRGRCPDILVFPWNARCAAFGPTFEVVKDFPPTKMGASPLQVSGGLSKDWNYYRWRYRTHKPDRFVVLKVLGGGNGVEVGWVVLKCARKRGLTITLVMDILARDEGSLSLVLDAAAKYSARRGAVALLALDDGLATKAAKGRFKIVTRGRLNFLVKGTDMTETGRLSDFTFAFRFGDLDFT